MPNYEKATITITSIGEKDNKFWIKDEHGEIYSAFKDYQGQVKDVWNQFQFGNHNERFTEGTVANISFTKSVGKDDKIYKNLTSIFPASGVAQPAQKPLQNAPSGSQGTIEKPRNYEREAYEKCCSIWAAAEIQKNGLNEALISVNNGVFYDLFQLIKKSGEKYFDTPLRDAVAKAAPQVVTPPVEAYDESEAPDEIDV